MTQYVSSPLLSMGAFNQDYLLLDNPSRLLEEGILLREMDDESNKMNRFSALEQLEMGKIYLSEGANQLEKLDSGEVVLRGAKESIVLVPFSQKQQYYRAQAPRVEAPLFVPVDRKREMLLRQEPSSSPYTLRNKALSENVKNLPTETVPRISDLVITGPSKRGHLGFLTLQYVFEGKEGQSLFQWERLRDSTNNNWEYIPGGNEKSYSPSVEDIGCEVRARVIPVSSTNINGTEVISPPVELFLDNKVKEEVAASSDKKRVSFEIHIGFGPNPVPRNLVITNSRIEIHHRNRPFSFGDVRVPLKADSLVFSHPSNPNVLCLHLDPQDAAVVSSSSVMLRTTSENEISSSSDFKTSDNPTGTDRSQGTDLEFICESNLERDVILMTIKHRIEQMSNQKKPEEKKQKEVVSTGLQYYLTEGDWQLMLTNANEFTYQDGQVVFEQATPNNSLYRIRAGNVRIIKDGGKVIGRMGPGSVLGEMSFLGNNVTTASVIAEGEVRIAEVEVQFIKQLFEVEPLLALKFYRNIAMKLSSRLRGLTGESGEKSGVPAQVTQARPNESWDIFARKRRSNSSENLMIREYQHCSIDNRNAICQLYQPKLEFITKVFGFKKRNDIFYVDIDNMQKFGDAGLKIHSRKKKEDKNVVFASAKDRDEVHGLVTSIMSRVNEPSSARTSSSSYATTSNVAPASNDPSVNLTDIATRANVGQAEAVTLNRPLSEEEEFQEKKDWTSIMSEAEKRIYTKGQNILAQGDLYQRLYQVAKGKCVIDINEGVIGEVNEGEIFGEMSFLQLRSASAAITAASETVELYVIEGYKLNRLIRQNTALGARFFKYIALVLEGRVQKREQQVYAASMLGNQ